MQIFIDTANINEIREVIGIIDGVTTNPTLIRREIERLKASGQQVNMQHCIAAICQAAGKDKPVSLEVSALDAPNMIEQGKRLYQLFNGIAGNVVIKIPVCAGKPFEALKAIKALEDAEIPVNATLIFTPEQALLAARAGATYVSAFAGRIDDYLRDQAQMDYQKTDYYPCEGVANQDNGIVSGVDLVQKIAELFETHEVDSNVLAASIRNSRQARECALAGAHIATLPYAVIAAMMTHPLTERGLQRFTADIIPEYAILLGSPGQGQQPSRQSPPPLGRPAQPQNLSDQTRQLI